MGDISSIQSVLLDAVGKFFSLLQMLIFIRVFLSWIPNIPRNTLCNIVFALTDPILLPIRLMIQKSPLGGRGLVLDFSPIIAFFFLNILRSIVVGLVMMFFGGLYG